MRAYHLIDPVEIGLFSNTLTDIEEYNKKYAIVCVCSRKGERIANQSGAGLARKQITNDLQSSRISLEIEDHFDGSNPSPIQLGRKLQGVDVKIANSTAGPLQKQDVII